MGLFSSEITTLRWSGFSLLFCILAFIFATLYQAFTNTGQAGLSRLIERLPRKEKYLTFWGPRWGVLRATNLLAFTAMDLCLVLSLYQMLSGMPAHVGLKLFLFFAVAIPVLAGTLHTLPRAIAKGYADRITGIFLPVISPLALVTYPLAKPVAVFTRAVQHALIAGSDEDDRPTSEEEIISLVDRATIHDLEDDERQIIKSVFEFGETITREIMTPRVDLDSIEDTETIADTARKIKHSAHSRFPVYHETMDDARGVVHVKDLLKAMQEGKQDNLVSSAVKEVPFVPESMPINDLLQLLRSGNTQMAIVVDEYGGTAGVVTMEDIMEELVGDIQDEYDREGDMFQHLSDGSVILDARQPVDEVNEALGISIPESEDYDSVGGFIFRELGRIPRPGETINGSNFQVTVQTANARQLHNLRILKKEPGTSQDS